MKPSTKFVRCFDALCLLLLFAAAGHSPAWGGMVVDVKTSYFDGKQPEESATISLDENCVRFDALEGGRRLAVIFRLDEKGEPLCWVVDTEKNTYVELDKMKVKKIQGQVEQVRRAFEEQMKNASPEQREQLKKAMEAQLGPEGGNTAQVEFKQIASGVKIKQWKCTQYEGYVNGSKREDVWAANEKDLGLTSADLKVLHEMGVLFSGISSETNAFFQIGKADKGFTGFPVVVVEYKDGKKQEKSEVKEVRKKKLDPGIFALPEGVVRQPFPE